MTIEITSERREKRRVRWVWQPERREYERELRAARRMRALRFACVAALVLGAAAAASII